MQPFDIRSDNKSKIEMLKLQDDKSKIPVTNKRLKAYQRFQNKSHLKKTKTEEPKSDS